MTIDFDLPTGLAALFFLFLSRVTGLMLVAPFLGNQNFPVRVRAGLTLAITMILFLARPEGISSQLEFDFFLAILVARELLLGLLLGLLIRLMFMGFLLAGEILGHEMGFAMARVVDPASGSSAPIIATLLDLFALMIFLSVNGHHWVLALLARTIEIAPPGASASFPAWLDWFLPYFQETLLGAVILIAPIFLLLMALTVAIGLLAKTVPQIHVLDFAFPGRILIGLGALMLFLPNLASMANHVFQRSYFQITTFIQTW